MYRANSLKVAVHRVIHVTKPIRFFDFNQLRCVAAVKFSRNQYRISEQPSTQVSGGASTSQTIVNRFLVAIGNVVVFGPTFEISFLNRSCAGVPSQHGIVIVIGTEVLGFCKEIHGFAK